MPTLPSGLVLAMDKGCIMPPDTNWFRAPEGHFWYWAPAEENPPPFNPEDVWEATPATAPVPITIEEVKRYVRIVIGLPDGMMYWEGDHVSDFPTHRVLSDEDLVAFNEWVESEKTRRFLKEAVDDCVRQSIANKQATGVARTKQTSDGRTVKEIVPPSEPIPKASEKEETYEERYARLLTASPEAREPMSDDDVQSVAVNVVARYLSDQGAEIHQINSRARIVSEAVSQPSILYKVDGEQRFVVVTSARLPDRAQPPRKAKAVLEEWAHLECTAYWVGVSLAHELDPFDPSGKNVLPLMKGFGVLPMIPPPVPLSELVNGETDE